jgi:hypothetical protein
MESFLNKASRLNMRDIVEPYAIEGVNALSAATPYHTGVAAMSWGYEIEESRDGITIVWTNSNVENGFPVVIALQYGYATGTGGYVAGRDFINPAIEPIFDKIADAVWKVVTSA